MSLKQSLLFFSLAALALGGTVSAQDRDQTFRDRDTNNDGVLTQGEYGGHPGNFRSLDVNGDGVLSYDEFVGRQGRAEDQGDFVDRFALADANHDGVLSLSEWRGDRATFYNLDRNDDRVLTRAEFNNEPTSNVKPSAYMMRRFRSLDVNRDGKLSRREAGMSNTAFTRADYDRNGVLSMDEFINTQPRPSASSDTFAVMDRNDDGVISSREWQGDRDTFDRLDRNDDRVLTRAEYGNQGVAYSGSGTLEQFRALDRNGNGVLSRSESGLSSSEFNRADVNRDGMLTFKEYARTGGDQFEILDRNNDGVISSWEWQGDRDTFDRLDRNNDRVLSRGEYENQRAGFFGSILGGVLGGVDESRFRELDVNNDGILRPSEWRGSMDEFDRMDLNQDGVITLNEYNR